MNKNKQLNLFRLKISGVDMSRQFKAVTRLIELSFKTLIDIDLSWCSLSLQNAENLFETLIEKAKYLAETYYNGQIQGTIRYLNLAYNLFQRDSSKHSNNHTHPTNQTYESSSDIDDDDEKKKSFDNFCGLFIDFI